MRDVLEWLNRAGPSLDAEGAVRKRDVAALLESINRDQIEPMIEWLNELSDEPPRRRAATLGWWLKRRVVNHMLDDCLVFPQLDQPTETGGWAVKWVPDKSARQDRRRWISLVQAIAWLAERGLLSKLRRCARAGCRRWFLRKKSNYKFCSSACGYAARADEPARKERTRNYMREFQRRRRIEQMFPDSRRALRAAGYTYSGRKGRCRECSAELEWWTRTRGKIKKIPVQQIGDRIRVHWSPHDIEPTSEGRRATPC